MYKRVETEMFQSRQLSLAFINDFGKTEDNLSDHLLGSFYCGWPLLIRSIHKKYASISGAICGAYTLFTWGA